jgi:hypothetical protein
LSLDYYKKSLDCILQKTHETTSVLVFCEENDFIVVEQNINQLKQIYTKIEFIFVSFEIPDWEQMLLMSLCDHNIIANSSFSWWGAYFNSAEKKVVCYPQLWFGPLLQHNDTCDMFPPEWTQIT